MSGADHPLTLLVTLGAIGPAWHVTLRGVRSVLVRRWAGSETADVSIRQGMLIRTPNGPRRDFAANTNPAAIGDLFTAEDDARAAFTHRRAATRLAAPEAAVPA